MVLTLSMLGFLSVAPCAVVAATEDSKQDERRAALHVADTELGKAWEGRDLDAMLSLYADDAVEVWTDVGSLDLPRLRAFWTQRWSDPAFRIISGVRDRYVLSEAGDLAYMGGMSSYRYTLDARQVIETGAWFAVWQWRDGGWKIVYGGFNRLSLVDAP